MGTLERAFVPALSANWPNRVSRGRALSVNKVNVGSPGPPTPKAMLSGSGKPIPTPTMPWLEPPSERVSICPEAASSDASTASRMESKSSETPASAKTACCSASVPRASSPELAASGFSSPLEGEFSPTGELSSFPSPGFSVPVGAPSLPAMTNPQGHFDSINLRHLQKETTAITPLK